MVEKREIQIEAVSSFWIFNGKEREMLQKKSLLTHEDVRFFPKNGLG
jgi:hypothetical protein